MLPTWFHDAVIYQVDPSTFHDSTGDGIGDLRGVAERLDYIRGLGATGIWLLPIYRSPFRDNGYDVSDHLSVDPRFGDFGDLTALLNKADDLGLHVLMDLVVQHTSDQHPWFQEARRDRSSPYRDYYIWTDDPEDDPATMEPVFPTVEDSVWTWDDEAGQYYRHAFYSHEPDLNHANPEVVTEIERIMGFWLRLGAAGFRVDAVPYMVTRAAKDGGGGHDGMAFVRKLRGFVDRHLPGGVLLGEVDVPPEEYAEYFDQGTGFTLLLNFYLNNQLFLALARGEAAPLEEAMRNLPMAPERSAYATFLRNHDELDLEQLTDSERKEVYDAFAPEEHMRAYGRGVRRRVAPMLDGDDRRIALAHAIVLGSAGSSVLLYGDEIGVGDDLDRSERESVRVPMPWTDAEGAGFSGADPADWVAPLVTEGPFSHRERNVLDQTLDDGSLLSRIGKLVRTRTGLTAVGVGRCTVLDPGRRSVLALLNEHEGRSVVMLANLADEDVTCRLPEDLQGELVDLIADQPYPRAGYDRELPLAAYGYRWLRPKEDLFR